MAIWPLRSAYCSLGADRAQAWLSIVAEQRDVHRAELALDEAVPVRPVA